MIFDVQRSAKTCAFESLETRSIKRNLNPFELFSGQELIMPSVTNDEYANAIILKWHSQPWTGSQHNHR
jgi:hypothetical protein